MGRPRMYVDRPWRCFEVTMRTKQARRLLRPGEQANSLVVGVLSQSLKLYGHSVKVHFICGTATRFRLCISVKSAYWKARFKCHFKTNTSKELGSEFSWTEGIWGRRSRDIPILDDPAMYGRLLYWCAHGVKESLSKTAASWPGVQWLSHLTEGKVIRGVWFDRTKLWRLRREWGWKPEATRGQKPNLMDVAETRAVDLSPLPMWADKTEAARRELWVQVVEEAAAKYPSPNVWPAMTPEAVMAQDPHEAVAKPKRRPAPWVHATDPEEEKAWWKGYASLCELWAIAADKIARGLAATFPQEGCHPLWLPTTDEEDLSATFF